MKKLSKIGLAFEMLVLTALVCAVSFFATGSIDANYMFGGFAVVVAFASMRMPVAAFETIPVDQVRAALTNATIDIFKERPVVKSFLSSFFPSVTADSKFISIEVQRGTEFIASDVLRGAGSNHNQVTRSTRKTFLPPYFKEGFNMNELEVYDTALLSANPTLLRQLAADTAEMIGLITDKVDRNYEKQRADALQSGIISVNASDNIDFRRKALSMVDPGAYWGTSSVDPGLTFIRASKWLRETGKVQADGRIVCILGQEALPALLNNPLFQSKYDLKNVTLGTILPATMNTDGASYHGFISEGSHAFDLWTYPEGYELANGTFTPYIDPKKVIFTVYNPGFKFSHAQVPQLLGYVSPMTIKEGFYMMEYMDPRQLNHVVDIMSTGIAVPTRIDRIYTEKVVAG